MNNDGWNDLMIAYYEGKQTLWINTKSTPLFQSSPQQTIAAFLPFTSVHRLALADVENTGGLSAAISTTFTSIQGETYGTVYLFKHDGNPAPAPPRNLAVSGQAGQHPFLQWGANSERDLSQYQIYKSYTNNNFTLLATVPSTQTYYEDVSETIVGGLPRWNERTAYYKVTALDNQPQESDYSNTVDIRVKFGGFEKSASPHPGNTIPEKFALLQNYPNPFNPVTTIEFWLPEENHVKLVVYSLSGQKVAELVNDVFEAGAYHVQWNGRDFQGNLLSSGIYIYQMTSGEHRLVKKMMLIK